MTRIAHVSQRTDPARFQILRLVDDAAVRARDHGGRGAERIGQVQYRRRVDLGYGGAGRTQSSGDVDGGRHLRGHGHASRIGTGPGDADDRQLRSCARHPLCRGDDQQNGFPQRRLRVCDQRQPVPASGHSGAAIGHGSGPADARHRRPGTAGCDPSGRSGGEQGLHRGGRGNTQASQTQGEGSSQTRRQRGQPVEG